jgi:hypothetical protein
MELYNPSTQQNRSRDYSLTGPNPASHNNLCHVVVALNVSFQRAVIDDPTERVRVVRVPIRAAIDLAMSGGIVQAMHVASMFLGLGAAGKWRP